MSRSSPMHPSTSLCTLYRCHFIFFPCICSCRFRLSYLTSLPTKKMPNIINRRDTAQAWSRNRSFVQNRQHVLRPKDIATVRHQCKEAPLHLWWSVFYNEPCCMHFDRDPNNRHMASCNKIILSSHAAHVDVRRTEPERGISMEDEIPYTKCSSLSSSPRSCPFPMAQKLTGKMPISVNLFDISHRSNRLKKFNITPCTGYETNEELSTLLPCYPTE